MEKSEIQKEVITLGKRLVRQLGLENSNDTLGRWLAHHIADLILKAENANGKEKERLSAICAEQILALWKHRWFFPRGHRPLEDFEPLLNFLQKFDAGRDDPYYYPQVPFFEKGRKAKKTKLEKELETWFEIAENVDRVARIWLEEIFHRASLVTLNPDTKAWLENAALFPVDHDCQIVVRIITGELQALSEDEPAGHMRGRYTKETLKLRIEQLKGYAKTNQMLIDLYQGQLDMFQ